MNTSMSEALLEEVRQRLTQQLQPSFLQVHDESAAHVGHAGAAGGAAHLRVRMRSAVFRGQSAVKQHRLVYDALQGLLPQRIHALALELAPDNASQAQELKHPPAG